VDRVAIPGEEAIKCAAWASLPLVSVLDRQTDRQTDVTWLHGELPSEGHMNSKTKARGQNRKTHFWTEFLLERKRRKEVKEVKRYTVLT